VLLAIYQTYYILAGIAGLSLYPWIAHLCLRRFQDYYLSPDKTAAARSLLICGLAVILCVAEVQFCFSRAGTLFIFATS
jgi:hypothetical protein